MTEAARKIAPVTPELEEEADDTEEAVPTSPVELAEEDDVEPEELESNRFEGRGSRVEFETPPANGKYRGSLSVRHIPRGVSGEQLRDDKVNYLAAGALWIVNDARVRITRATGYTICYVELPEQGAPKDDAKIHNLSRARFLKVARPE